MPSEVAEMERASDNVPDDWREVAVADVVAMLPGFAFKSENFVTGTDAGLPLIRIRDLGLTNTATRYVGDYDEAFAVRDGDILVGMDGTFEAVRWQGGKALLNQRVLKLSSSRPDAIHEGYLFYRVQPALSELEQTISGTTVKHLSTKDLKRLRWQLPPLDEQRRIAEVLRSVDEALCAQQSVVERMKASLDAICNELLPDPTKDALPPRWTNTTLGDFAQVATGKTPSTKRAEFWDGDIPFVTPTDLTASMDVGFVARHLTDAGAKQTKITLKNSVLYTCIASVGKMGLAREEVAFNQQINACACKDKTDAEFLFWALQRMTQSIRERCGTTAVPIINKSTFSSLPLFIPECELRVQISSTLTKMALQIDEQERVIRGTIRMKDQLMSDLLSGHVRVPA